MLTEEQIKNVKEQLFSHINKTFPEDKKNLVIEQINSMNPEELESFLKQNKIINNSDTDEKCIFCSIVSGEIPSYLIEKNEYAVAVLEINPISKAHVLIIPKNHDSDLKEKRIEKLIKEISKRIKTKFKPKEINVVPSELMGHKVINILPIYEDEDMKSKRMQVSQEDLKELQKEFKESDMNSRKSKPKKEKKAKEKKAKVKEEMEEEEIFLPRRIP